MILGLQPRALPLGYGIIWWQQQDSNLRLTAYEAVLEPSPVMLPAVIWCGEGDSNPYTSRYQDLSLMRLPVTPPPRKSWCRRWDSNPHGIATNGF